MKNEDFFKEIAMTKHPFSGLDTEIAPLALPENVFAASSEVYPFEAGYPLTFEQRSANFTNELAAMRAQYQPYMRSLSPPLLKTESRCKLSEFAFRYLPKQEAFSAKADKTAQWENITIPDYRGPAGEDGKWRARYLTHFKGESVETGMCAVLCFECVDYKAVIYVNGCFVGEHEGFFAPFSFDITAFLLPENELIIEIQNDIPILGVGPVLDGDKIYAATGPGWDDPDTGWHHCPAGAGVFGEVYLAYRPEVFVSDVFVRANIDENYAEVRVGVINYTNEVKEDYKLNFLLVPKNYTGNAVASCVEAFSYVGAGQNEYRFAVPLHDYLLWEPQTPWLYAAQLTLCKHDAIISTLQSTVGIKKLISDETSLPKGKFFMNNHPIVLRGANEMGHLQQCVMRGDKEQLIDDILIAKLCNLNYYRVTQRPVQAEIYDAFDMLGMMHQCDFPLFSFLRRPQFAEAVRQSVELEHLVRSHVSTALVTFINEPVSMRKTENPNDKFSKRYTAKGHRHLLRDELEAFFVAARKAIYLENPDRIVKNAEGDYDPPTAEGMPDFHCYTMWYTNHAMPIGRFMKGYLPAVKSGWMVGCGEYGAEGLDSEELLREHCPKKWLMPDAQGRWYPTEIVRSQTFGTQGDWYEEQATLSDWVRESQLHQSNATRLMTDALRRRADLVNHIAIHLLIDAWPTGWMKAIMGCDRKPKPAYFAYQDSLIPFRLNLYMDRQYVYGGETINAQAWLLNDTANSKGGKILITAAPTDLVAANGKVYQYSASVEPATAVCAGLVHIELPCVEDATPFTLFGCVLDENDAVLTQERLCFTVYPKKTNTSHVAALGELAKYAATACGFLAIEPENSDTLLISEFGDKNLAMAEAALMAGKNVVLLLGDEKAQSIELCGLGILTKRCADLFFAVTANELNHLPLYMLYNENSGFIDYTAQLCIEASCEGKELAYLYGKADCGPKPHIPLVQSFALGTGKLTAVSLHIHGRVGVNANLDELIRIICK